jgi:hypothetical protein
MAELRRFNPAAMPYASISILIGIRQTGKSTLIRDILWHHEPFQKVSILVGYDYSKWCFQTFAPGDVTQEEYSAERVRFITDMAETTKSLLVLHNCIFDQKVIRQPEFCSIFNRPPHLTFFMSQLYAIGLQRWQKERIDYVFVLRENFLANRRRIYEQYASDITDLETFNQLMLKYTQNYGCLVVDNTNKASRALEDRIFWYCAAANLPPFSCISSE